MAEGEAVGAVLDEGEDGWMGFAGGVQCAEWGLRTWDLRPCLPARACVDPPCVNAEQHHRACTGLVG